MAILHFLVPENVEFAFHDRHPQPGFSDYRPNIWHKHQADEKLHIVITRLPAEIFPDDEASFEMSTAFIKDIYQSFLQVPWEQLEVRGMAFAQAPKTPIIALQHGTPATYEACSKILTTAFGVKEPEFFARGRITVLEDGSIDMLDERDFEVFGGSYVDHHAQFRKETREKLNALQVQANEENDGVTSSLLGRLLDTLDVLDTNAPQ